MIDSTKRHENRCVGGPGHGRTEYTHVWSLRRTGIDFRSILCRFCVRFLLSYNLYTTRTPGRTAASPLQTDICHPANQRIARSLPTRTIFLSAIQSVVLSVCRFVRKSFRHNLLIGAIRPADHDGTIRFASNRPVRPLQVFLIFTVSKKWSS